MTAINIPHAARALMKTPFVSIVAVLSLSLGIGANARSENSSQGANRAGPAEALLRLVR
jgi:hypothetical protein